MWRAIRYRRAQALVIAALSALITACAVFAPLYDRALQQSLVSARLAHEPVQVSGLRLTSSPTLNTMVYPASTVPASSPEQLAAQVRGRMRSAFTAPERSISFQAVSRSSKGVSLLTNVTWRQGMCGHLRFSSGRCPASAGEVAVSGADARNWHWRVGDLIRLIAPPSNDVASDSRPLWVRVSGIYRQAGGDYWYGSALTGWSGTVDRDSGQSRSDVMVTPRATTDGSWLSDHPSTNSASEADFPLRRDAVGIDRLLVLGPRVSALTARLAPEVSVQGQPATTVYSGLPQLAQDMQHEQRQAAQIVPMLMVQLALLALVVLWLVLGAVVEQRRPEVALARLRGRGRAGARRLVLREVGVMVLAGVPAGVALALVLSWLGRRLWLPAPAPFEWRTPVWAAVALAAVVLAGTAFAAVVKVSGESVASLLRKVPARQVGWRVGAADAVVIAIAVVAVVNVTSGSSHGPLALVTPTLLALAVGLALAHLVVPLATAVGRAQLARGRLGSGLAALQIARRPATRRVVAVLTVSTALLVFAANALVIGARNRSDSAQQVVGAARVVTVDRPAVAQVRSVLHRLDPQGRELTPVVQIQPPGPTASTVQAVVPRQFQRIALFPGAAKAASALPALIPNTAPPVQIRGKTVSVTVSTSGGSAPRDLPVELRLQLLTARDQARTVILGNLPYRGARTTTFHELLPCAKGCTVTGISLDPPVGSSTVGGQITLSDLRTPRQQVSLGPPSHWHHVGKPFGDTAAMAPVAGGGGPAGSMTIQYTAVDGPEITLTHGWIPSRLPALVTGGLPAGAIGDRFDASGLDGIDRPMRHVGSPPFVPGAPRSTILVDLDMLQRSGHAPATLDTVQVWFAHDDQALASRLTAALQSRGIAVAGSTTPGHQLRIYNESASAIGLGLALVVGVAALLIAALVLIVLVATSWRLRTRDYAALRLAGVSRRRITTLALGEQLPVVALAAVVGSACGVYGAHLAMPNVPLFATPPAVSVLDLATDWPAVLLAGAAALVLLTSVGLACGRWLSSRSQLSRVRELP